MEYDGIKSVVCDAEESDWLDISYSERKYVDSSEKRSPKTKKTFKLTKAWKIAAVAVLCVAVLAGLLFADGDFKQGVFDAVKSAVASVFGETPRDTDNKINIPCNITLVNVEDGVMTFGGGRAAMSLTSGTVSAATENSVTVQLDEKTSVVYSQLTSVLVNVGDKVYENSLLGKYSEQYSAVIVSDGETVKQVVGSETQLTWNI